MKKHIQKFTFAATISLLSLITFKTSHARASVLFIGKYALFRDKFKLITLMQQQEVLANLSQGNNILILVTEQPSTKLLADSLIYQHNLYFGDEKLAIALAQSIDNLRSAEQLNQQMERYSETFVKDLNSTEEATIPNSDRINQDLRDRYHNLVQS